ncbi:hypothetical protein P3W43_16160 [Salinicola salarius]|uniref:hypothetical protein n=1 Tax=Salinicola salarius TaxID=430457 RepID=UPI0023E3EA5F|nr:hypothetical protein [Salinicola salarius]MDF3920389.1 hypothetical protein [Salinicola salarius]
MVELKAVPSEPLARLPRRVNATDAEPRLRRFGAERFEPAWLSLWAVAIGREAATPLAWLLAAENLPRALLVAGELDLQPAEDDDALALGGGQRPTVAQFERWWLWERLARPRRWSLRVQPSTMRAVELPLWLGYSQGRQGYRQRRQTRLIVLSGLSGEALGALKPAVLAGLRDCLNAKPYATNHTSRQVRDDDPVPG